MAGSSACCIAPLGLRRDTLAALGIVRPQSTETEVAYFDLISGYSRLSSLQLHSSASGIDH